MYLRLLSLLAYDHTVARSAVGHRAIPMELRAPSDCLWPQGQTLLTCHPLRKSTASQQLIYETTMKAEHSSRWHAALNERRSVSYMPSCRFVLSSYTCSHGECAVNVSFVSMQGLKYSAGSDVQCKEGWSAHVGTGVAGVSEGH